VDHDNRGYAVNCQSCGAENEHGAKFCYLCGSPLISGVDLRPVAKQRRVARSAIGGVMMLVSGLLGILNGVYYAAPETLGVAPSSITWIGDLEVFGLLVVASGVLASVGGILSVRRTAYAFCVACGFLGALSMGFTAGYFLCLAGMTLVGFSRDEFVKVGETDMVIPSPPMFRGRRQ